MDEREYTAEELYRAATAAAVQDSPRETAELLAKALGLKIKPELPKRVSIARHLGLIDENGKPLTHDGFVELTRRYNAVEEAQEYMTGRGSEGLPAHLSEVMRILRERGQ